MSERNETIFLKSEFAQGDKTRDNRQFNCGEIEIPQAYDMETKNSTEVHSIIENGNHVAQSIEMPNEAPNTELKQNNSDKSSDNFENVPKKSGNENKNGLDSSEEGLQGVLTVLHESLIHVDTISQQIAAREDENWTDLQSLHLNNLNTNIMQAIKNIERFLRTNLEKNKYAQSNTADVGVQTGQFFGIKKENGVVESEAPVKIEKLSLSLDPSHLLDLNEDYSLLLDPQFKDIKEGDEKMNIDTDMIKLSDGSDYMSDEEPVEEHNHADIDYKPGSPPLVYGLTESVPTKTRLRKKKKLRHGGSETGTGRSANKRGGVARGPKRKKPIDCDTCGETFRQEKMLLSHMVDQHNMGEIKCDKCSKLFASIRQLQIHKRRHDRYHCHLCNRDLSCRKNFENHQLVAHSSAETKQECEICNKKVSMNYMERHIKNVHDKVKPHQCDECGKGFSQVDHLREHKLSHSGERPFKCDLCDKAYSMKAHLWTHKANHHRGEGEDSRVMCGHCGKLFRFSGLKKHESLCSENPEAEGRINEDGIKTFGIKEAMKRMCQKCGKWFSSALSLKNHEVIHTGEKKIKCDICGEGFRHYNALYAHKDSHNPGTEYPCDICGKSFKHKENLRIHTYRHIKPRTFPCEVCGKTFNEKGNLKRHMNIHTGEKSYRCEECGRNFAQPEGLKIHSVVHTGEKPYKCDDCGKAFTQCGGLSGHKKRCHVKDNL